MKTQKKKSLKVSASVPPCVAESLAAAAKKSGRSASAVMREILKDACKCRKNGKPPASK